MTETMSTTEIAETLRHELEANLTNALAPAFDGLCASIREEVAGTYREGITRAFDALCEASESLRQRMSDGEADMRDTCALMQVTRAMLELLSLKVRG